MFWSMITFRRHRFYLKCVLIVYTFLSARNHVFDCKTHSFKHFSLFQKSMNFQRFWYQFLHNFGSLLPLIFNTFSASNFGCLFGLHFFDFFRFLVENGSQNGPGKLTCEYPFGAQDRSKNASAPQPRYFRDFGSLFDDNLKVLASKIKQLGPHGRTSIHFGLILEAF